MKERIRVEAERLFWRYGVRSVTMEDIARPLGISKKTIYQHFGDKEDILCQIIRAKIATDTVEISCMADQTMNPIEEILGVLEIMRKKQEQVNPSLFIDVRRYYPQAYALLRQHIDQYVMKQIIENIQKGKNEGVYRSDVNPLVLARMRIEQIELSMSTDITSVGQCSVMEIQQQLTHHFVRGMLTEKGFGIYNAYVSRLNEYNQTEYESN